MLSYFSEKCLNQIQFCTKQLHKGNLKSVQFWIKKGDNIEGKNSDGQTALHYAASVNRLHIVEFLLEKGAKIEEKDKKGHTPLHFAVSKGFQPIVEILIKHDANLEAKCGPHHC